MLTKTATIILGIIQKHPVNAYELIKMLSRFQLKDWYDIADSTVYATLKSLEKKQSQIAITSWTPRGKNLAHGWSRRIYP